MVGMKVSMALVTLACVTFSATGHALPTPPPQLPNYEVEMIGYPGSKYIAPNRFYVPSVPAKNQLYLPPSQNLVENEQDAHYGFAYNVLDYPSGNDFGHMESRDGSRTTGRFYVLLPDGRKQVTTYVADENGYQPIITYE